MKIVKFRGSRKLLDLRISTQLLFCSFYQPQGMNQENDWIKMGIAIIFPLKHHPLKVCDCDCIIFQQTLSYKIKNKTNWFHQHFFQYQFLSIKKLKCLCYYYCPQIYLALKTLLWRNVKQKYLSKIQLSIRITAIHVREGRHVYNKLFVI